MLNLLFKIKHYFSTLKEFYYSIVVIKQKNLYYYHQTINYLEQNIYGIIHNLVSSLWLLILFFFLLNDINYFYLILFILAFGAIFYIMIIYLSNLVPKTFLNWFLSLSYFYKVESELMNLIIYILFLLALSLSFFFGIKTYFFIRLLFFFRCFLTFIFVFYQSLPNLQIEILKNCLIIDIKLLDVLHPMEKINVDDFIKLQLKNNEIDQIEGVKLLERYRSLSKKTGSDMKLQYERKIKNDKIVIISYHNIIDGLNKILNKWEKDIIENPNRYALNHPIINLKELNKSS